MKSEGEEVAVALEVLGVSVNGDGAVEEEPWCALAAVVTERQEVTETEQCQEPLECLQGIQADN